MSRQDYANRRPDDPGYDASRAIARAHLDLADALFRRRQSLGYSPELVAERSGISPDRLEMIEEGDTTSLSEVLRLCRSLRLVLTIDDQLRAQAAPAGEPEAVTSVTIGERYAPTGASG